MSLDNINYLNSYNRRKQLFSTVYLMSHLFNFTNREVYVKHHRALSG